MKNFCNVGYRELMGRHQCECGQSHEITAKCLLMHGAFGQAEGFFSQFVPPLSRIALIYDDESMMRALYDGLKKNFRITCIAASFDKKQSENAALPEDSKLILAVGGFVAFNCAKYKATLADLPLVLSGLPDESAFMNICTLGDNGLIMTYKIKPPVGFIYDLDIRPRDRAALLGTVAARLNTAFEQYVSSLIEMNEYCPFLTGALSDIAAKTILDVSEGRTPAAVDDIMTEAALKLALIQGVFSQRTGEVQCALTYSMLCPDEFSQGELQFVFAAVLTSLFTAHLRKRKSFTPPPDNNYRLERIAELFDVSEYRALRLLRPQLSGHETAVMEYKTKEYSRDMLFKLELNKNLYLRAFKSFKRMYKDGGYSLMSLIGHDISLSLALAPDLIKGSGMLTVLKRLGELDCYII